MNRDATGDPAALQVLLDSSSHQPQPQGGGALADGSCSLSVSGEQQVPQLCKVTVLYVAYEGCCRSKPIYRFMPVAFLRQSTGRHGTLCFIVNFMRLELVPCSARMREQAEYGTDVCTLLRLAISCRQPRFTASVTPRDCQL